MTLVESHGLANRPGEPYPATFRMSVDPLGIEPTACPNGRGQPAELAPCHLAMSPLRKWSVGESNPDCLGASQASFRWTNAPLIVFERSVRELNPALVLTTDACGRNTYRPNCHRVIPDGVEPSLSWVSSRRRSRWTTGSLSDQGGSRTHKITRLSTWSLCRFAYPVIGK